MIAMEEGSRNFRESRNSVRSSSFKFDKTLRMATFGLNFVNAIMPTKSRQSKQSIQVNSSGYLFWLYV